MHHRAPALPGSGVRWLFRFAAIIQGVYKRGLEGIASSEYAETFGTQVRYLADTAWQIASRRV